MPPFRFISQTEALAIEGEGEKGLNGNRVVPLQLELPECLAGLFGLCTLFPSF